MRVAVLVSVLLCCVASAYAQTSPAGVAKRATDAGESELISLDERLSESIKQNHLDGLMKYMLDDGAFLDGAGAVGLQNVRNLIAASYGRSSFALDLKPTEAHRLSDYSGYTMGTYLRQGENQKCHCAVSEEGEYLMVWKRSNGEWRVKAWIPTVMKSGQGCGCGSGGGVFR